MAKTRTSMALVLAAAASADDLFTTVPGGCQGMLGKIGASGHNDMELAAYCRANMPPKLCQDALNGLGQQPWSADHIASTCKTWEEQWNAVMSVGVPGREAMDFSQLQETLNGCMAAKAQAGLCQKPSGKPMALNECVDHKQKIYPDQTKKYSDALNNFYGAVVGGTTAVPSSKPTKGTGKKGPGLLGSLVKGAIAKASSKAEETGPVAELHSSKLYLLAVPGLAVAALAAGVVGLRRLRRRPAALLAREACREEEDEEELMPVDPAI
eukprot:CAMPEP_0204577634 /NCGR_PEP_ID=MMETSP0661-20131031/42456_1 /ASSEMBLY_ACC=CAM_ASM_000606 /TAXON_ID=109239 /ORGANISM="Alexandrium margalefi, Strain AMGDE01CS-322" /LENGTH=267 /DNA_ID=CAMNT_0051586487 /DNA_START=77 /DNA_END=880 /DNA_ORIENTATION=-